MAVKDGLYCTIYILNYETYYFNFLISCFLTFYTFLLLQRFRIIVGLLLDNHIPFHVWKNLGTWEPSYRDILDAGGKYWECFFLSPFNPQGKYGAGAIGSREI